MDTAEILKNIRTDFDSLNSEMSNQSLGETIRSLTRNINRVQTEDKALQLQLKKIALDLTGAYTNQLQYSELRNKSENPGLKVKPEFDASFFESLVILRTELYTLLEKL